VKFPERLEIVSEFPMTPSGKIQKYRLREIMQAKIEAEARPARPSRSASDDRRVMANHEETSPWS
jgi:hypothetical protein